MSESQEKEWYENVGYEILVSKEGSCRAMHHLGQLFVIDDYTTPKGMCMEAFHSMYPLLFAGRIKGDFKDLGSEEDDIRLFNCPSREVQFYIQRFYQCNNCGKRVKFNELTKIKKNFEYFSIDILACSDCLKKLN